MNIESKRLVEYISYHMLKNPDHERFRMTIAPDDNLVGYLEEETNTEKLKVCLTNKIGECIVEFKYIDILEEYHLDVHKIS